MTIGNIKPGMAIVYNNELYTITECEHAKLGRGGAFCRVKMRNMKTTQALSSTLRESDDVKEALIEKKKLNYLYRENNIFHFMDMESYEDIVFEKAHIKDKAYWLKENCEIEGLFYENKLIDLEIPLNIELSVTETDPGYRGDTVKTGTKPAKLETGIVIQVPLFINVNDKIKVDTRNKTYLERAK